MYIVLNKVKYEARLKSLDKNTKQTVCVPSDLLGPLILKLPQLPRRAAAPSLPNTNEKAGNVFIQRYSNMKANIWYQAYFYFIYTKLVITSCCLLVLNRVFQVHIVKDTHGEV